MNKDTLKKLILLETMTKEARVPPPKPNAQTPRAMHGRFAPKPQVQEDPIKVSSNGEIFKTKNGMYFVNPINQGYSVLFILGSKVESLGDNLTRAQAIQAMKEHHDKKMAGLQENEIDPNV